MPPPLADHLRTFLEGRDDPGIASAYLFGSHAEGREHRESDVDVGVLFSWQRHPSRRDRFEARLDLIGALGGRLGAEPDVVVLNDAPPLFGRRIVTEGLRILCRDPEADHAYVRDVQLLAADLAPWLRRMRQIKLEALAR